MDRRRGGRPATGRAQPQGHPCPMGAAAPTVAFPENGREEQWGLHPVPLHRAVAANTPRRAAEASSPQPGRSECFSTGAGTPHAAEGDGTSHAQLPDRKPGLPADGHPHPRPRAPVGIRQQRLYCPKYGVSGKKGGVLIPKGRAWTPKLAGPPAPPPPATPSSPPAWPTGDSLALLHGTRRPRVRGGGTRETRRGTGGGGPGALCGPARPALLGVRRSPARQHPSPRPRPPHLLRTCPRGRAANHTCKMAAAGAAPDPRTPGPPDPGWGGGCAGLCAPVPAASHPQRSARPGLQPPASSLQPAAPPVGEARPRPREGPQRGSQGGGPGEGPGGARPPGGDPWSGRRSDAALPGGPAGPGTEGTPLNSPHCSPRGRGRKEGGRGVERGRASAATRTRSGRELRTGAAAEPLRVRVRVRARGQVRAQVRARGQVRAQVRARAGGRLTSPASLAAAPHGHRQGRGSPSAELRRRRRRRLRGSLGAVTAAPRDGLRAPGPARPAPLPPRWLAARGARAPAASWFVARERDGRAAASGRGRGRGPGLGRDITADTAPGEPGSGGPGSRPRRARGPVHARSPRALGGGRAPAHPHPPPHPHPRGPRAGLGLPLRPLWRGHRHLPPPPHTNTREARGTSARAQRRGGGAGGAPTWCNRDDATRAASVRLCSRHALGGDPPAPPAAPGRGRPAACVPRDTPPPAHAGKPAFVDLRRGCPGPRGRLASPLPMGSLRPRGRRGSPRPAHPPELRPAPVRCALSRLRGSASPSAQQAGRPARVQRIREPRPPCGHPAGGDAVVTEQQPLAWVQWKEAPEGRPWPSVCRLTVKVGVGGVDIPPLAGPGVCRVDSLRAWPLFPEHPSWVAVLADGFGRSTEDSRLQYGPHPVASGTASILEQLGVRPPTVALGPAHLEWMRSVGSVLPALCQ
uniref:collagen alpha-1(I) chain-like n=1 Tax=Nyctereutes procyonoides TaxID=34880 RepID=UPI00244504B2|nr:collagen alpha-1(I) chain-like [Nyctereutes procyonoides]